MPGDVERKLNTSVRWVARLGGSSGIRATWSSTDDEGLGLAGVPVGRAVLHKSAGSVCSEVLVALRCGGEAEIAEGKTPSGKTRCETDTAGESGGTGEALTRSPVDGSTLDRGSGSPVTGIVDESI